MSSTLKHILIFIAVNANRRPLSGEEKVKQNVIETKKKGNL